MRLSHKNRPRHDRRLARKRLLQANPHFGYGSHVRITTDVYGSRYKSQKVTVVGVLDGQTVRVKSPRRKAPMEIRAEHLKAA